MRAWLSRWRPARPMLDGHQQARLAAWSALPVPGPALRLDQDRLVVIDVETTGLDIRKDRLIAIGAVAIAGGRIALADSFERVLRQAEVSDKDNILVHGIGGEAQREGVEPVEALLAFLEYLGNSPLLAFHVAFDETMISAALRRHLGLKFRHAWSDLAYVAPALYPRLARQNRSLDHWSQHFQIGNFARHSALADALATAELLLALRPRLAERRIERFGELRDLERNWRAQFRPV